MTHCVALDGVTGRVVTVQADVHDGLPGWSLTGLVDTSVSEARDRCRAAMSNSRLEWPDTRITVALYPADIRKVGSHYDLAIALSLLAAQHRVPGDAVRAAVVFGELGLDGRVRSVPGVLPAVLAAADAGLQRAIVPEPNLAEASLVESVRVLGVRSLAECVAVLCGEEPPAEPHLTPVVDDAGVASRDPLQARIEHSDLADVRGQAVGRWCVEVAAAGGHHVFLEGPPGAGKTMLAERFPALLPPLGLEHSIEVSTIHSVAGLLSREEPRIMHPPFLAPNHSDSVASVIGGGSRVIKPGAISLAHRGVLFMDEAPEFKPTVHDALRQPLESGLISIRRADTAARFPAEFLLFLAANPCPCGMASTKGRTCTCSSAERRRYRARISGPVRDRIDVTHTVTPVSRAQMREPVGRDGATSAVAARVLAARQRQVTRFADLPWQTNADVPGFEFRRLCPLGSRESTAIEDQVAVGRLTQRGADRVCRIAWTLADLAGRGRPSLSDVQAALYLRTDGLAGAVTGRVA